MSSPSRGQDARNGRKPLSPLPSPSNFLESAQRFWRKSYAGDYTGLLLLALVELLVKSFGEPFHQLFLLSDTRLQHPHADVETVPVVWLFAYAGGVPLLILALWTLVWRRDAHKAHVTILGLAGTLLLTSFVTDVLKDAIGRPRPDLISRCKPDPTAPMNELVSISVCTETSHHLLHDGWRSFPSGHSSFAFAGLGWLALFFASQTRLLHPGSHLLTVLLCFTPILAAALISISRLEDYRHDVFDVVCGALLGITMTYANWRRYYPGLTEKYCDEPYSAPSGSGRTSPIGFQRVRDEEDGFGMEDEGAR